MYTAQVGRRGVVVSTIEEATPTRHAYHLLRALSVLAALAVGVDKRLHFLADWDVTVTRQIVPFLPVAIHPFVLGIGALEIVLGALFLARPRAGGIVLALLQLAIVVDLVMARGPAAVILVYVLLAAMVFAVSRLATAYAHVTELPG